MNGFLLIAEWNMKIQEKNRHVSEAEMKSGGGFSSGIGAGQSSGLSNEEIMFQLVRLFGWS